MLLEGVVQLGREGLQTGGIFLGGDDELLLGQLGKGLLDVLEVVGCEVMMVGIAYVLYVGRKAMQIVNHGLGMGDTCDGQQMTGGIDGWRMMRIVEIGKHGLWGTIGDGGEVELLMG